MTLSPGVNDPAQQQPIYAPPPPQPPVVGRKVSAPWTGALLALGALAAAISTFLPFEKIIVFHGGTPFATLTFTGLGSKTATGAQITGLKAGNGGLILLVASIVVLVCAVVVVAGKGRLWASIVGLVAGLIGGILAIGTFGAAHDDQKKLNATAAPGWMAHALTKIGADIAVAGFGVVVVAAILALCVRRRRAA
jgi:hypothetical protein